MSDRARSAKHSMSARRAPNLRSVGQTPLFSLDTSEPVCALVKKAMDWHWT